MLYVDNQNEHDPALNLALEEHLLRKAQTNEDLLLLYINAPSIIIGRHQNILEEINHEYVEQQGIRVVRRLSGGGAVYHDLGNLNFSFITNYNHENVHNYKKFTDPVIRCLDKLGVHAGLSSRNDILIDGIKVSGNAQYISQGRMVSHGTLLFNSDLTHVADALHVQDDTIESKGIKSVRSPVANISEFLSNPINIEKFQDRLLRTYFEGSAEIPIYPLSGADWMAVRTLADERYRSWEWNYGHSPEFKIQKKQRFPFGEIGARLDVRQGVIESIEIFGDFFAESEPDELEKLLVGVRYERGEIELALQNAPIDRYLAGIDLETFSKFLY